jgi:hypothetical protein
MQRCYSGEARVDFFVMDPWAQNISQDASAAVLEQGKKLVCDASSSRRLFFWLKAYGGFLDPFTSCQYSKELCSSMCCAETYADWIAGDVTLLDHQLESLFGKHRFTPLPLFTYIGMMDLTLITAVAKVLEQGYNDMDPSESFPC